MRFNIFHQWLLVVGIFNDASFRLRYAPRLHSVFSAAEASPLWRSGTSFASHAMGLRFEPGRVRSCIFVVFFSFGSDCGLRPFKIEFDLSYKKYLTIICF